MPFSSVLCKDATLEYILNNFSTSSSILDIGCGNGTYSSLLKPHGYSLDGVEVYGPNIEKFELASKYVNVWNIDAKDFKTEKRYDLVIFGDVLEHFSYEEAKFVIDIYKTFCDVILVSVPYEQGQGVYDGNVYEIHKQADLNDVVFKSRYPEFKILTVERGGYLGKETIAVWILDQRPADKEPWTSI